MGFGDFIKEPSSDSYYVPPPQLPAVVFSFPGSTYTKAQPKSDQYILFSIIIFSFIYVFTKAVIDSTPSSLLFAAILFALIVTSRKAITEVSLTDEYATLKYGLIKKKNETVELHNYCILINKTPKVRYPSKHHGYSIFLIPKKIIHTEIRHETTILDEFSLNRRMRLYEMRGMGPIGKQGGIPISPDIYTPENLKEYVEGINGQLTNPLPIVFGDQQVMLDYQTGKYKAKTY